MLFYSVPVLQGILDDTYLAHYTQLVEAIWLLLQDSITNEDLLQANQSLQLFCLKFATYYGMFMVYTTIIIYFKVLNCVLYAEKRYMTIKVHQLLHLVECVKNLGPLWAHSCFPFENINGKLRKMFHGTRTPHIQVCIHVQSRTD